MTIARKPRKQPEAALQRSVLTALAYLLPRDAFFTHFPLGGGGYKHGARMKQLGARRGVPDLCILWNGTSYWLELKSKTGRISPEQFATMQTMKLAGAKVDVVRNMDQLRDVLRLWQIPTRQSAA